MTEFSPFSCPIFLGHPEARASASKASGCFMGGTHDVGRGTGKAEAAKQPDAGISLKRCPGKWGRKRPRTGLSKNRASVQTVGAELMRRKGGSRLLFESPLGANLWAKRMHDIVASGQRFSDHLYAEPTTDRVAEGGTDRRYTARKSESL